MWIKQHFNVFRRVRDRTFSIKFGTTTSEKNAVFYVVPSGTSRRLLIPLTDQRIEIGHFATSIVCVMR
jgi:hypothetical protein